MKKKRQRLDDQDENEKLLRENRELKKEVRSLQQQVKKLNRGGTKSRSRNVSNSDLFEEDIIPKCPECHKGSIVTSVVANRRLQRCSECDWRAKAVKL